VDARYAGALKAFLSHNPDEQPISPGAPDPLRDRMPERTTLTPRRAKPPGAGSSGPDGTELLPLILAQLPMEKSYRIRPTR
jgi:hypothetical protein